MVKKTKKFMQYVQVITFSNSKQKTLKKTNLIVSKVCVCKKRYTVNIFSLYTFLTCKKTLRGIILRT